MTVASTVHSSISYLHSGAQAERALLPGKPVVPGWGPPRQECSAISGSLMRVAGMRISARVVPNAKQFRIERAAQGWKIYVKEKAEDNKANIALLKGLRKLLGMEIALVSGAKSREKVLEIEGTEKEVLDALRKACAGKGA